VDILKIFKRYIKGRKLEFIGILVILFTLNYLRSNIPLLIGKVFGIIQGVTTSTLPDFVNDFINRGSVYNQLLTVAILIIAVAIVRDVMHLGSDYLVANLAEDLGYRMQTDFYSKVHRLSYEYLNSAQTGDLIQRSISDSNRTKRFIGHVLPDIFGRLLQLILISTQMLLINFNLAIILLIPIPILLVFAFYYFKAVSPEFEKLEQNEGALTTTVQENLTGIRIVKAFANEKFEITKFKSSIDTMVTTWRKMMDKLSNYYAIADTYSYLIIILAFGLGVLTLRNNQVIISDLIAIFIYAQTITWPARALGRQLGEMKRSDIAGKRILEVLDLKDEYEEDGTLDPKINGTIEFKNVSFKFSDASEPILKNISLKINEGETIAIVGKTGSGKSTLVNLINRMIEPSSGQILIDGTNIKDIKKHSLRKQVVVVLQEPFLFSKTVADNIGITLDKKTDQEFFSTIENVAKIASLTEDIDRFKDKYETIVGERGVTLSGGQKQRVAIARALVSNKPIIVFDDALSAVDTDTDLKIRNAIKSRGSKQTTLIITHRITTAMEANRIIVIENGTITAIGTHEELIKKDGLYSKIWSIQNQGLDQFKGVK
jgi:ATP-binding cassette subfamily B protein